MSQLFFTNEDPALHLLLEDHKKPVTCLAFNPNDRQFASGSQDHNIMIWNSEDNFKLSPKVRSYRFCSHEDVVTSLDYSRDGGILASSSKDHTIRLWVPTIRGSCVGIKDISSVNTVSFSPDNTKLVSGGNDKAVKVWDVQSRKFVTSYLGHNSWVNCAKYSTEGNMIVSSSDDRTVRVWDVNNQQNIHVFTSTKSMPTHVAFHSNGYNIAVAMNSGSVRVYDIRNKKLVQHYVLHDETTCIDWHPTANFILSCGKDGKVRVIDCMEGRPIYTLSGHEGSIYACRFSSDGRFIATAGEDTQVLVWKTNFLKEASD